MHDVAIKLYHAAVRTAEREDAAIRALTGDSDGVFSVPELAYAYLVGKEFVQQWAAERREAVTWDRERSLGAGPVDLVLTLPDDNGIEDYTIAVEFKVRSTLPKYQADLNKLLSARHGERPVNLRIFLALVDRFEGKSDPRIDAIGTSTEGLSPWTLRPISQDFARFSTETSAYKGKVECVVAAWIVEPEA